MTGLEYVLIATFAAVWLTPLTLAVRWERRLRQAERDRGRPPPDHRPSEARGTSPPAEVIGR